MTKILLSEQLQSATPDLFYSIHSNIQPSSGFLFIVSPCDFATESVVCRPTASASLGSWQTRRPHLLVEALDQNLHLTRSLGSLCAYCVLRSTAVNSFTEAMRSKWRISAQRKKNTMLMKNMRLFNEVQEMMI